MQIKARMLKRRAVSPDLNLNLFEYKIKLACSVFYVNNDLFFISYFSTNYFIDFFYFYILCSSKHWIIPTI